MIEAILKKEFIIWFRYPLEVISSFALNIMEGIALAFGFSMLGNMGSNIIASYVIWMLYMNVAGNAAYHVNNDAVQGTLQRQIASHANPLILLLSGRLSNLIYSIINISLILLVAFALGLSPGIALNQLLIVFVISIIFNLGLSLMYSALALLFKATSGILGFINMMLLALAVIASSSEGLLRELFRWFPYTQAVIIINTGISEWTELIPLILSSLSFLLIGFVIIRFAFFRVRKLGILAHY